MKKFSLIVLLLLTVNFAFAQTNNDVLKFKSNIGFKNGEDSIEDYKFLENNKKILIIGKRNLQIWDVENAKLLHSVPNEIPQFAPRGFVSTYLLLGLPKALDWRPYAIDTTENRIITSEKIGENKMRSAVVRDLQTLKQITVLNLPDVSTEYITYDDEKKELLTFGKTDGNAAFASWNDNLSLKELTVIKNYDWHQTIRDDKKMIVGSDGGVNASLMKTRKSSKLTLRDVKTGKTEKEYTIANFDPKESFSDAQISADEKYLSALNNDRLFVWEIDGDGMPKFEISRQNPKEDFDIKSYGKSRFIVVKSDGKMRFYDISGSGTPSLEIVPQNAKENLHFVGFIREKYAVVRTDGFLRIYEIGDGKMKYEFVSSNPKDTIYISDKTEDEKYILLSDDQKAAVLDSENNFKPLFEVVRDSPKERFYGLTFFEDKNLIMIARANNSEKKAPRTEFYDIRTGKISFTADFLAYSEVKFTPDEKRIYQTNIGSFQVWDLVNKKLSNIPLATYTEQVYDSVSNESRDGETRNVEDIILSPDNRYFVKDGKKLTTVFDMETGNQLQILADPTFAKYDRKTNRLENSGLNNIAWTENGKYLYAFGNRNVINFWERQK